MHKRFFHRHYIIIIIAGAIMVSLLIFLADRNNNDLNPSQDRTEDMAGAAPGSQQSAAGSRHETLDSMQAKGTAHDADEAILLWEPDLAMPSLSDEELLAMSDDGNFSLSDEELQALYLEFGD